MKAKFPARVKLALFVVLLLGTATSACGIRVMEQPVTNVEGVYFISLAVDPATPMILYAGTTDSGVLKSTDGGVTWRSANSGLTGTRVTDLVIDPAKSDILYSLLHILEKNKLAKHIVFKSENGGGNWHEVNTGLTEVLSLAIDPLMPSTIYAGTYNNGVYKSMDGGRNWDKVNIGIANERINVLIINPLTPTTLYAGTANGVFKSTNGGLNWNAANESPANTHILFMAIDPITPDTLFAGTGNSGVLKSSDGGVSWSLVNTNLPGSQVSLLAIDPISPSTVYVVITHTIGDTTVYTIYKSIDGGENWKAANTGLNDIMVFTLAIDPVNPSTLYAGTATGLYKSTDGGGSWSTAKPEE